MNASQSEEPTAVLVVPAIRQPLDLPGTAGGPLAGLRFVVKDVIDVAGEQTTAGSQAWVTAHPGPAAQHAPVVVALLAAGARLVGKSVSDELAFSINGTNPHDGTPPNPAAPGHVPGGSSAGSASAVASGSADVGIGTDTGGSVRVPASYCGIYGLRPSHGLTDLRGVVPLAPSFDTVGWFARDVATMSAVASVLLPPATSTSPAPTRLVPCLEAWEIVRPRVGDAVLAGLRAAFGDRVTEPRRLGIDLRTWAAVRFTIQTYETWQAHGGWVSPHLDLLGKGVRSRMEQAARTTHEDYLAALDRQKDLVASVSGEVAEDEVICLPTTPTPAPTIAESRDPAVDGRTDVFVLGAFAGLWGSPELTIPRATVDGLPVGISLVGRPGSDRELLDLAASAAP